MLLLSRKTKQLVMVELTVPWKERMEKAYARKKEKYKHLVQDCKDAGRKTNCYPIEVGCRGFVGQSIWQALSAIGIVGEAKIKATIRIVDNSDPDTITTMAFSSMDVRL
jgi:hypothetical protein